jgi:hypothetical protein
MRHSFVLASLAITGTFVAAGCGGGSSKPAASTTRTRNDVGLLFVQAAPHGTFMTAGGEDNFTLTLRDSAAQVIWFSDRPERHYGHVPIEKFVGAWKEFGFAKDPPNAALTLLRGDDKEDTVIVKLGQPRYDAARDTLSFPAHRLVHAPGRLADFESDNDGSVPERFADASLFIDDTSSYGPIICHGCHY